MKKRFLINQCVTNIKYRLDIYQKLLDYYQSRIDENRKYKLKPWYYKAILSILDLRMRYRPYNENTSNIHISMVLNTYHFTDSPILNETTMKHYFPELYDAANVKNQRNIFDNDKQRIEALKKSIRECELVIEILHIA